jgi:hypothetical protein
VKFDCAYCTHGTPRLAHISENDQQAKAISWYHAWHYKICNGTPQYAFVTIKLKSSIYSPTDPFHEASTGLSSNCL